MEVLKEVLARSEDSVEAAVASLGPQARADMEVSEVKVWNMVDILAIRFTAMVEDSVELLGAEATATIPVEEVSASRSTTNTTRVRLLLPRSGQHHPSLHLPRDLRHDSPPLPRQSLRLNRSR